MAEFCRGRRPRYGCICYSGGGQVHRLSAAVAIGLCGEPRHGRPVATSGELGIVLHGKRAKALWVKTIVPASLVYLISPVDFVPDVIPGLGQLDDLAIVVIGVKLFIELCPPEIVREHMQELLGESNWRVEPDEPTSPPAPQIIDAPYEIKKDE